MKGETSVMKSIRVLAAALASALAPSSLVNAEDIDLFVSAATSSTVNNPNVLFIIDNTANWSRNDQHWTDPNGLIMPFKQGQSELRALKRVIEEANDKVNVGLMMFHGGSPKGTYVRYAVQTMTGANKAALSELIGDNSCADGVGANGTPKCIFKNFDGGEKVPQAFSDYSGALFEAFKYLGGCTSPANAQSGVCKTSPLGPTGFGVQRYSNFTPVPSADKPRYDLAAYADSTLNTYVPPAGTANSCAKNYIVFIGNGFPQLSADGGLDATAAAALLSGVEGSTTQLAMPNFTTTSTTTNTIIGNACSLVGGSDSSQISSCTANIPQSMKDTNPADSYTCVTPEQSDPTDLCPGGAKLWPAQATKTIFNVTATGTSSAPLGSSARFADEWARYLFTTDVNGAPGLQNAYVYTLDVFKDQQDQNQTALLLSMAKYGGGRYFQAASENAILKALRDIMTEIQSVNTVFASASLPSSTTVW